MFNLWKRIVGFANRLAVTSSNSYILEYRYSGYPRSYFLNQYFGLKRSYGISTKYRCVPHLTIVGPIRTRSEEQMIESITKILSANSHHFHKKGNLVGTDDFIRFHTPENCQVLAIEITPPERLKSIKTQIERTLEQEGHSDCVKYDKSIWHTTLWKTRRGSVYDETLMTRIWNELRHHRPQQMKFILDRLTLVKNGRILFEFDLVNNVILDRLESLDNDKRHRSYLKMKKELESKGESFRFSTPD